MYPAPPEDERELQHLADDLFIATDRKDWISARALFVDGDVDIDLSSLAGGGQVQMSADALIAGFTAGLHPGKTSHHMTTNYRITIESGRAEIRAHGYAWNHVPSLPEAENTWETWGNYLLTARRVAGTWKLDGFRYYSRLTRGNEAVRTHTAG
jgi:hypothetical protein